MSIRYYLKVPVARHTRKSEVPYHPPTGLILFEDTRGTYIMDSDDPYKDPAFTLRKDLQNVTALFSCVLFVTEALYHGEIPTGSYTNGDEKTSIIVAAKCTHSQELGKGREIRILAPTWARVTHAIEQIRKGEVTPVGREQTMLERAEIALAQVEGTNHLLRAQVLDLTVRLTNAEALNAEDSRVMGAVVDYLSGRTDTVALGVSIDRRYLPLQERATIAKRGATELAAVKATLWHRLGHLFLQT